MSHRSRLCALFFDSESDHDESIRFWAAALGRTAAREDEKYTTLEGEPEVILQHAGEGHQGMHVDIETDDVNAEVARLEGLGARRKYQVRDWWVMEAPGGHAFCVVPAYTDTWPGDTREWN